VSCYFRHLREVFEEAGIEVTPANRKEIDKAIRAAVGTTYKDCPSTWKKIKTEVLTDRKKRQALVRRLQREFGAAG
jgi:8-oxo-dGTP pyrophosphatase MutT (NUDIX family)